MTKTDDMALGSQVDFSASEPLENQGPQEPETDFRPMALQARIHPHWVGGRAGYVYSVICNGELLVDRSAQPEGDAARALLARGITGKLTLLDGKTGRPRLMIDIEKMAGLTVEEGPHGPRFVKYRKKTVVNRPSAGEEAFPGPAAPPWDDKEAAA